MNLARLVVFAAGAALFNTGSQALAIPVETTYVFEGWCTDCPENAPIKKKEAKKVSKKLTKEKEDKDAEELAKLEQEKAEAEQETDPAVKAEKEAAVIKKEAKFAAKKKAITEKPLPVDGLGSTATAVLVVKDYTAGTPLQQANFVSFEYTSTVFPHGLLASGNVLISGVIPLELPGPAEDLVIEWLVAGGDVDADGRPIDLRYRFLAKADDDDLAQLWPWELSVGRFDASTGEWVYTSFDEGIYGVFGTAAVPVPGTLALFGLGLMGFLARRPALPRGPAAGRG